MKKRLLLIACALLCVCGIVWGVIALVRHWKKGPEGPPVVIAILDTGISTRAIPAENLLEGKNYLDTSLSTEDTYGHGTAVASLILDLLPQAQFVPLVSNAYEDGKIKQVDNDVFAQMIRDAIDVYHCQIINISVGLILDKPAIREAVAYAEEKGVLVVASAGNDYTTGGAFQYYPASYETVLAVGSVNEEKTALSEFSQRGKWVDIYACGENVEIATLSGDKRTSEGTSYSAARVTTAAAKLLQNDESLTASALRQKLLSTATELPDGKKVLS